MTAAPARQGRDRRLWTADQFLDFIMARPDEERWQLVDGIAMMMVPPSFTRQRVGRNLSPCSSQARLADIYAGTSLVF